MIGVCDDPPGDASSTQVFTNIKDITNAALSIGLASVGVSYPGNDLTSGGDSGDSNDVTYPAYDPCSLGGGDGNFNGVGNGPPWGLDASSFLFWPRSWTHPG